MTRLRDYGMSNRLSYRCSCNTRSAGGNSAKDHGGQFCETTRPGTLQIVKQHSVRTDTLFRQCTYAESTVLGPWFLYCTLCPLKEGSRDTFPGPITNSNHLQKVKTRTDDTKRDDSKRTLSELKEKEVSLGHILESTTLPFLQGTKCTPYVRLNISYMDCAFHLESAIVFSSL